ncbi:hypothetical protein FRC09_002584 [Ceratobasidium sp. 395]|nr:hypothetical protein FRC09_002584 [Ceratobasidium sp. 395]
MSDEECIALLTELCKGITPATDPEADLEKALAALDEIIGTTGRDAGGRGTSDTNSSITLSVIENDPTSTGWSGCMRLEDVIDCAMILDTALEVDPSESDDGLEYLATPKDVPMEVDEMLAKMEWKGEGTSEVQTMCPLQMLKQL